MNVGLIGRVSHHAEAGRETSKPNTADGEIGEKRNVQENRVRPWSDDHNAERDRSSARATGTEKKRKGNKKWTYEN